ncbi:MAG: hypothetical protein RDV48_18180 [Candidatus Eremiobacteraeota bacterium]|nr:hypothetical protein [Candidatus Eremiobacteraeota bacterium]
MENKKLLGFMMAICAIAVLAGLTVSFISSREYPVLAHIAILFVGKDTKSDTMAFEKKLQSYFQDQRARKNILPQDLSVVSYHFDKADEKQVCEEKFEIHDEDLPFLGVVEIDDKNLPVKVLRRLNGVGEPGRETAEFFDFAVTALTASPSAKDCVLPERN